MALSLRVVAVGVAALLASHLGALVPVAAAQEIVFPEAGIRLDLPPEWDRSRGDDALVTRSPDDTLVVTVMIPPGETWEEVIAGMDERIAGMMDEMEASGPAQGGTTGGFDSLTFGGTGTIAGTAVEWTLILIEADEPVAVVTVAADEEWEANEEAYREILESIGPAVPSEGVGEEEGPLEKGDVDSRPGGREGA